jgi:hypothetical protein
MQRFETRSQRSGGNRALAGRNTQVQHIDDSEALVARQAMKLRAAHRCSFEVALVMARLAYAVTPE